ncbi:unnamed protein product [Amoebophrya sp. A120]|nr:unnamed protein product [Amoebophrya sp. A120]|eukprot:GSA120T00013123001.1
MPAQLESPSKKAFGNMMLPSEEVIAPKAETGSGKSANIADQESSSSFWTTVLAGLQNATAASAESTSTTILEQSSRSESKASSASSSGASYFSLNQQNLSVNYASSRPVYSKEDYDLVKQELEETKAELGDLKQKFLEMKRKSIFDHFVKVLSDTVSCK